MLTFRLRGGGPPWCISGGRPPPEAYGKEEKCVHYGYTKTPNWGVVDIQFFFFS